MKPELQDWFSEYSENHINRTNQRIHCVAVPVILWTVIGLFWSIPWPWMGNGALIVFIVFALFFIRLSFVLTLAVLLSCTIGAMICQHLETSGFSVLWVSVVIFVVAWICQFIGHEIEGKKPSFFKDLQFLLIGPGWVLNKGLRKVGIII